MDQVSRPLQVVLAAAVLFAVLWFVALRPKPDSGPSSAPKPTPPAKPATPRQPGSSLPGGLGRSVTKADQARSGANQAVQASQAAAAPNAPAPGASTPSAPAAKSGAPAKSASTANPASLPTTAPGATPAARATPAHAAGRPGAAAATAGRLLQTGVLALLPGELARNATAAGAPARRTSPARPAPPRRRPRDGASPAAVDDALAHGRVVALLFWNPRGSDDQLVRGELRRVSTHHGRALIAAASIRSVSGYGAVTRGVQVLQSPTVLIVDRARRARVLTGYTDAAEIGQAVSQALAVR
jgi:hypothetical protein